MNKIVIDHSYALGMAWDKTRYRNHGALCQTAAGNGFFNGSLSFEKGRGTPGSMVVVPPSPSLERIGSVRVRAQVYVAPKYKMARRHNLVEGHLSFALFVNMGDRSLQGTFLAPDNNWIGLKSGPGAVPLERWNLVEFWYDGVGSAELLVNTARVATSFDPARLVAGPLSGPVRGIGPQGVCVGHWAALEDRYTLDGHIRRVQVYKRDNDDPLKWIDDCCKPDPRLIKELAASLVEAGFSAEDLRASVDSITELGAACVRELTGGDEQAMRELLGLAQQYSYTVQHRRSMRQEPALEQLMAWIGDHASNDQLKRIARQAMAVHDKLPIDDKTVDDWTKRMCFTSVKDAIEKQVRTMVEDDEWQKRFRAIRRRGDSPGKDDPKDTSPDDKVPDDKAPKDKSPKGKSTKGKSTK